MTEPAEIELREPAELRSFGRRLGRKLSPRQSMLFQQRLPRLKVQLNAPLSPDLTQLFAPPTREVWLEIGFGGGEHLVWQAKHNPHIGLIGCEPFVEGVVKVLSQIDDHGLGNIRLHDDDARPLLRHMPPASIDRAFVLFPDPWPKTRHRKRRLVSGPTLELLARVMKPGAVLRIGTDIGDYARTILEAVAQQKDFRWTATGPSDWREQGDDWPVTRYQQKAIREGRRSYFLRLERT